MSYPFEVLLLGLILSVDSFSAAVALGNRKFSTGDMLKFACASSGAEAASTLVGYVAGAKLISAISAYDHWIAFGLLAAVALHLAFEGFRGLAAPPDVTPPQHFHSFSKIVLVSIATSMDAFGVGIGLGLAQRPAWPFVASIAGWAFAATIIGLYVGKGFVKKMGPIFTLIAAAILGYISVQMLKI